MIFVDQEEQKHDGKFAYYNKYGEIEGVLMNECVVHILQGTSLMENLDTVYAEDIPNLIKALQAAYNFWEKNNG